MQRRPSSSTFFSANPVFGRTELAESLGRYPGDRAVTELLKYHLRTGSFRRIARGVFASAAKGALPATRTVDRFLAASRLRIGAVIAYRSALELHGCAVAGTREVQLISCGEPGLVETANFACRFLSPPRHHSPGEGVTTVERQGLAVNVTTLGRTLVDLFDRYKLAGGAQELFQSLDIVAESTGGVDIDSLVAFAGRLRNAAAAGALGYWLECERDRLRVPAAALEELRSLASRQSRYAIGATPGHGRAATGWNVILPDSIIERYVDD